MTQDNSNAILKFEYKHNRKNSKDLFCTQHFFFTATSNNAPMLSVGKTLYLVIIDNNPKNYTKKDNPKIIGKAKIKTATQELTNEIKEKYANKIEEWHWNNFVELCNVEVIDDKIEHGIDLHSIINKFGLSMFPNTKAKDPHKAFRQKSYRSISNEAASFITKELEQIGLKNLNNTNISKF